MRSQQEQDVKLQELLSTQTSHTLQDAAKNRKQVLLSEFEILKEDVLFLDGREAPIGQGSSVTVNRVEFEGSVKVAKINY